MQCSPSLLCHPRNTVAELTSSGAGRCPRQVIIISDGSLGVGESSLRQLVAGSRLHLPFSFPCRLDVVLLGERAELERRGAPAAFQRLVELSGGEGAVHTPEPPLSAKVRTDRGRDTEECWHVSWCLKVQLKVLFC